MSFRLKENDIRWKSGFTQGIKATRNGIFIMLSLCAHLWIHVCAQAMPHTCNFLRRIILEILMLSYPEVPGNYSAFFTLETHSQWLTQKKVQMPFPWLKMQQILLQFTFQRSLWDQDKIRLHSKPYSCQAPFPSLLCFSHSLARFSENALEINHMWMYFCRRLSFKEA